MIKVRKSDDRGRFDFGWLDTRHSFSFGQYHDPKHMGFRSLRVINEDFVAPGQGFEPHPHRDMEIISYVVEGALKHEDNISAPNADGHSLTLRPGEVQRISAGTGIVHSEFNPSDKEQVHLIQIWILPDRRGHTPGYDQREFPLSERRNRLRLVASQTGQDGSIPINQDAYVYASVLDNGGSVEHDLRPGRGAWVQVIKGDLSLNGTTLAPGDAAAVENETKLALTSTSGAEFLLFDLM
jgi:redox-sensitive bicupin YhaK (pirin superfamily)